MEALPLLVLILLVGPPAPAQVLAARLPSDVRAVAVTSDGAAVAAASTDRTVRIWDVPAARERLIIKLAAPISEIAFAPHETRLATLSRSLELWDTRTGKGAGVLPDVSAFQMAYAASGALAIGGYRVQLRDALTLKTGVELEEQAGWLNTCVAFAPDGKLVAAGDMAGNVWVWETAGQNLCLRRKGHLKRVTGIGFIDDGRTLVSGGQDGRMKFWDVASGREVGVLVPHSPSGPDMRVDALACSFDGKTIATAGAGDGTVRLWEAASGRLRATLPIPGTAVTSLAIALDGSTIAIGGKRGKAPVVAAWRPYQCGPRLAPADQAAIWQRLSGDPETAYRAILALASNPRAGVASLRPHLHPVAWSAAVRKECDTLIAALDSDQFDERATASRKLAAMSPWIESYLEKAITGNRTLELRRRLQTIVRQIGQSTLPLLRAIEALEHASGPEARDLLQKLAAGEPAAPITRAARRALQRTDARHGP